MMELKEKAKKIEKYIVQKLHDEMEETMTKNNRETDAMSMLAFDMQNMLAITMFINALFDEKEN